jgi:hypothetical protein
MLPNTIFFVLGLSHSQLYYMVTAPAKDRIYGSNVNKPGSSSSSKTAESISLSDSTIKSIQNKIDEHNANYPKKKVTLEVSKAVVRRGMGAYSSSHRPTISGGKPNSRVAWGLARLNAFLYKIKNGKSKSGKYSQDNDLIDELGYKYSKFEDGGIVNNLVDLKFYDTTSEHAKIYGFDSPNPLFVQITFATENHRINNVDEYARKNNYDLIFGTILQKEEQSIDRIKTMLRKNGYSTIEGNNDFYKYIDHSTQFAEGGAINKTNMKEVKKGGITYGPSHAEGGIPVKNKSTNEMLEVEGGEGITNKHVMASSETVKLNGKEMTLCEAVSAINQMDGNGVKFNCDDVKHKQFIEEMAQGGELERGTRTEEEHIQVLRDLYAKRITPEQATEKIAKDHLKEDKDYYKKLSRLKQERYKMPKGKICGCGCSLKSYDNGGMLDSFGLGSFEEMATSFSKSKLTLAEQKKEIIDLTLTTGRDKVDTDFKADLMKNTPQELHKYWENASHVNLYKYGWRLQFTTSRVFAGLCSGEDFGKVQKGNLSKDRNLFISINFVKSEANWKNNYLDTILHECAHAIVREMISMKIGYSSFLKLDPMHEITEGHGKIWEMVCQAINPNGSCNQFYENAILENTFYEYSFECQNCGNEGFGRTKNFTSNCSKCFKPVIIEKNL